MTDEIRPEGQATETGQTPPQSATAALAVEAVEGAEAAEVERTEGARGDEGSEGGQEQDNSRGLNIQRPGKEFTQADVPEMRRRVLAKHSQIVPKEGGTVEPGDILVAEVTVREGDRVVGHIPEHAFQVEKQLSFKDGL